MKRIFTTLIFVWAVCGSLSLHAQKYTHGTDFWVTFARSEIVHIIVIAGDTLINDTTNLQIRIAAGNQAATGSIYFTHLKDSVPFSVSPWSVFTHNLTFVQTQAACYELSRATTSIADYSVHITSDNLVSVYALNQYNASTDASNVLPVSVLGTDYYNISYGGYNGRDAYAILATQNNTQVYHDGVLAATLNRGEVYYSSLYISWSINDMTGAHITADKPVALFAVIPQTFIPYLPPYMAADNLFQQLPPVSTWGNNFFVPVSRSTRDFVRIVALQNGTNIKQTGAVRIVTDPNYLLGESKLTNLNAGQFVNLEVSLDSGGCYIQANNPVGVCAYLAGCTYNAGRVYNGIVLDTVSDPAQAWLPPIEQKIPSALVAPFIPTGTTALNAHYALIITSTAAKNSTTVSMGGATATTLSGGVWHDHASGYSFYDMPLTNDTSAYLFTNTVGKLIVMGYGTGRAESYYYLAASAMRNLAYFEVDSIHYLAIDGEVICNENIEVMATVNYPMDTAHGHLRWFIDSVEQPAFTDSLHWTKQLPLGKHTILMIVKDEEGEVDSLLTSFTIQREFTTIYDTICQGNSVFFGGKQYGFSGIYTDSLQTVFGCDSIVTLHLLVNPTSENTIYDTVCQGDSVFFGGKQYNQTGIYTDTLQNVLGCDSIVTLDLTVLALLPLTVNLGNDTTICWLDSLKLNAKHADATHYQWQDNSTGTTYTVYYDGEYWVIISNRCSGASDTINISYLKEIELNLGSDTVFCEDDVIDIQLDVTSPYASYQWQDGSTLPIYTIKEAGMYGVTVSNACMSVSKALEISTKDCRDCRLRLPNIFTPKNGEYVYLPEVSFELHSFSMTIYNRWGGVVYQTNTYASWDGKTTNGQDVSAGVYYCVAEYSSKDNPAKKCVANSSVTVVR
jgi:hypothetical protein